MTPAAAIPVFLVSIGVMLAASAVFARRLDHIGLRLGLPEAVLGLLTALAADAPELASAVTALVASRHEIAVGVVVGASVFNLAAMLGLSAVVTARIRARHETLELEAFVGLWMIGLAVAVAAGALGSTTGMVLVAVVAVPYVVLLAAGPRIVRTAAARARRVALRRAELRRTPPPCAATRLQARGSAASRRPARRPLPDRRRQHRRRAVGDRARRPVVTAAGARRRHRPCDPHRAPERVDRRALRPAAPRLGPDERDPELELDQRRRRRRDPGGAREPHCLLRPRRSSALRGSSG